MRSVKAAQAYQRSATFRSTREQEADVFRRVNAQLRGAVAAEPLSRAKALADNERLWITLGDVLRDPDNKLPLPLRATMLSIGASVRREAASINPDIGFIIGVNEQIAAGLSGIHTGYPKL